MLGSVWVGFLLRIMDTFDFRSWIETRWKRCRTHSSSSEPVALAKALPSLFIWPIVVGCRAPSVSIGRGMKDKPSLSHNSPYILTLLLKPVLRAWPGSTAARATRSARKAFTTVISRQASLPEVQFGRYRSAGLASDPGIRACTSFRGERFAEAAVWKSRSQRRLCRDMRSPWYPQDTAWSPKLSEYSGHAVHLQLTENRGTPRRYKIAVRNSGGRRWRPSLEEGTADENKNVDSMAVHNFLCWS